MAEADDEQGAAVRELAVAVVKGTRLQHPGSVEVGPDGIPDDRRFHVVAASGRQLGAVRSALTTIECDWEPATGRLALRFPDGSVAEGVVGHGDQRGAFVPWDGNRPVAGREVVGPWSEALSAYLEEPVVLVEPTGRRRAVDVAPLTLVSDASVARLEGEMGAERLGTRRFRMTLALAGLRGHEEDEWYGRRVAVGSCCLRITGPVPRCVVVTHDPDTGRRDHATLKGILAYRTPLPDSGGKPVKAPFGVYAEVEAPGAIAAGDDVRLLD
jgi:uncharacterized protein YcbX